MKRFIALLLCFTLFFLNACSSRDKTTENESQKTTELPHFEYTVDEVIHKTKEQLSINSGYSYEYSSYPSGNGVDFYITPVDGSSEPAKVRFILDDYGENIEIITMSGDLTSDGDSVTINLTLSIVVYSIYSIFETVPRESSNAVMTELRLTENDPFDSMGAGENIEWFAFSYDNTVHYSFMMLGYNDAVREQQSIETTADTDVNIKAELPHFDYTVSEITKKMKENILHGFDDSLEIVELSDSLVVTCLYNSDDPVTVLFHLDDKKEKVEKISLSAEHTVINNESVYNETLAIVAFSIYSVFEEIKPLEVESIMTALGLFETDTNYLMGEGENIEWESYDWKKTKTVKFYPIGYFDANANVQSRED